MAVSIRVTSLVYHSLYIEWLYQIQIHKLSIVHICIILLNGDLILFVPKLWWPATHASAFRYRFAVLIRARG